MCLPVSNLALQQAVITPKMAFNWWLWQWLKWQCLGREVSLPTWPTQVLSTRLHKCPRACLESTKNWYACLMWSNPSLLFAGAEHTAAQVPTCVFRVHKKLICIWNVVKSVISFCRSWAFGCASAHVCFHSTITDVYISCGETKRFHYSAAGLELVAAWVLSCVFEIHKNRYVYKELQN